MALRFVVSHPFDERLSNGWGTGGFLRFGRSENAMNLGSCFPTHFAMELRNGWGTPGVIHSETIALVNLGGIAECRMEANFRRRSEALSHNSRDIRGGR